MSKLLERFDEIVRDIRGALANQPHSMLESNPADRLTEFETADFCRRMRFCARLFPDESGNAHAKKSWGDIFEAFEKGTAPQEPPSGLNLDAGGE